MIVDTHCHLDVVLGEVKARLLDTAGLERATTILQRAKLAGVSKFVNVGCDVITSKNSLFLSQKIDEIYCTVGIHPTECNIEWREQVAEIKKMANDCGRAKLVGIGEIGLDFYHKPCNIQKQKDACLAQIELALSLDLPISFHVRDAADEFLRLIEPYVGQARGVMHCFQQPQYFADIVVAWGYYLGVDGPITYPKNQELRSVIKNIGLDRLVLETDAPFLPPQPYRGKENESAFLVLVVKQLSEMFGISDQEVCAQTTQNAKTLFGFDAFSLNNT